MIRLIHSLGICHRDLHEGNIVVKAGKPMVIDLEHAVEVDPLWPCYDLYGPSDRIQLLPEHEEFRDMLGPTGIWWDADHDPKYGIFTMGMIFGSLRDVGDVPLGG